MFRYPVVIVYLFVIAFFQLYIIHQNRLIIKKLNNTLVVEKGSKEIRNQDEFWKFKEKRYI